MRVAVPKDGPASLQIKQQDVQVAHREIKARSRAWRAELALSERSTTFRQWLVFHCLALLVYKY